MEQAYLRTCLGCGAHLVPNIAGPETPPWTCRPCLTHYWVAELTQEARSSYRPRQHDWGHRGSKTHKAIRAAVYAERVEANRRGVSLRREQLGLVRPRTLANLLERGHVIHPDFEAEMRRQLA